MSVQPATPSWTFTASAGGFAVGTGRALARWLDRNAYGMSHTSCGFDLSLEKVCNPTDVYPKSETSRLGATVGLRRAAYRSIGTAVLYANWSLKPAHLAGLWLDATYGVRSSPFVLRAQYRVYGSTRSPTRGFGDVTPSTLFLGLGLAVSRME